MMGMSRSTAAVMILLAQQNPGRELEIAEIIDQIKKDTGDKAYVGRWGFDFDDILYLFAPVVWLGWQMPFVLGASVGAPVFALYTWYRLHHLRRDGTDWNR